MKIKLVCTQAQFESLHYTLDKTRSTSKTVTVDKQALINLLLDHGVILGKLPPGEIEQ